MFNFSPATGRIDWVKLADGPPDFKKAQRYRGARAQGVRYEKKVQGILSEQFGDLYLASPWIQFSLNGKVRWCQPDGVLFSETPGGLGQLIEVKNSHTALAWYQLFHLYRPVLKALWPSLTFAPVEVVKWFDCAVAVPQVPVLCETIRQAKPNDFSVHILNP